MTPLRIASERGFTLVEFAIVSAMSALVVFTLAAFYINAQHMWIDSSLQAVTQRDASIFVNVLADRAAAADSAYLSDPGHLYLFRRGIPTASVGWVSGDDRAFVTEFVNGEPTTPSLWPATGKLASLRFRLPEGAVSRTVVLDSLHIETSPGERVFLATTLTLLNRP